MLINNLIASSKDEYLNLLNEWADEHLLSTVKDAGYADEANIISRGRDVLPECIRLPRE